MQNPEDADTMESIDGRSAVRLERKLTHPIDKVWRAVTESQHLGQWFPAEVEIEMATGGRVRFGQGGELMYGTVLTLDPPHEISFSWGDDILTFELADADGGTRLRMTHTFDDRAGGASFAAGWQACLAALGPVLADEPLPPTGRMIERHEELVHRFGLDHGVVTESPDGWTIRFERQLTCPADIAWDLFLGRDQETGRQRTAPSVGEPLTPFAAPEVTLGIVTEMEVHRVLAFDTAASEPGDHVRLEFGPGTGHGARMLLTVRGSSSDDRTHAYEQWGDGAVEHVAAEASRWAVERASSPAGASAGGALQ